MQDNFSLTEDSLNSIIKTITYPRLKKYKQATGNDDRKSYLLYRWNTQLSQCLYWPLQTWEIAYRNSLSSFFYWKFGKNWPYDGKLLRQLKDDDKDKLAEAIDRQRRNRGTRRLEVGQVVADLTPGFWVSMMAKKYEVPFGLRPNANLGRIVPGAGNLERHQIWKRMDDLRDLRNRMAHHEPIFHLDLAMRWSEIQESLAWLCADSLFVVRHTSSFERLWTARPV